MSLTPTKAREALRARRAASQTWSQIAEDLDENPGFLWNIANGKRRCPHRLLVKLDATIDHTEDPEWSAQGAWLPDYMITDITAIGGGNFSKGVRRLWRAYIEGEG